MSRNRPSRLNISAIVGLAGVVVTAILLGAVIIGSQPSTQVIYVPNDTVPAFRTLVVDTDLTQVSVKEDEIFADALTPARVEELTSEGRSIYTVERLQKGAPILVSQLSNDPLKALQVVSSDEQLVGVTTSASGSVAGTLRPGDVVDVVTSGTNSGQVAGFAKVIGFGTIQDAGRGVAGVEEPVEGSDGGDIQVILAVSKNDAAAVAGAEVSLSKHPYCQVSADGRISAVDETRADACAIPSERAAGQVAE